MSEYSYNEDCYFNRLDDSQDDISTDIDSCSFLSDSIDTMIDSKDANKCNWVRKIKGKSKSMPMLLAKKDTVQQKKKPT